MKLWGGRFEKETDVAVDDYHSSIHFDKRLYKEDITGSIAHAKMLGNVGIISKIEAEQITKALENILIDIENGVIEFDIKAEDIHMNIETILISRIGDVGKKLHTARSRNDQVALDSKMFTKNAILDVMDEIKTLQDVILELSKEHTNTIMAGFTHLQKAQPISLAHHLMAYFQMFKRDYQRLESSLSRVDIMPLGAGALAGTTFPIDRHMVANELGFSAVTENSLDSVSDRDFVIEFESNASISMMHLSRLCEELIIFSTDEYRYITLDDSYSTGSSIMPQKKNPDVCELMRGKTGRVYGNLIGTLTMMKGLPLAYNKDMQEDKEALFDTYDTWKKSLSLMAPMLKTMRVNKDRMRDSAKGGFINATDLADYLANKGVAFRDAHRIVGELVLKCQSEGRDLSSVSIDEFKSISPLIESDIYSALDIENCVNRRDVYGAPSASAVLVSIENGRNWLDSLN